MESLSRYTHCTVAQTRTSTGRVVAQMFLALRLLELLQVLIRMVGAPHVWMRFLPLSGPGN